MHREHSPPRLYTTLLIQRRGAIAKQSNHNESTATPSTTTHGNTTALKSSTLPHDTRHPEHYHDPASSLTNHLSSQRAGQPDEATATAAALHCGQTRPCQVVLPKRFACMRQTCQPHAPLEALGPLSKGLGTQSHTQRLRGSPITGGDAPQYKPAGLNTWPNSTPS